MQQRATVPSVKSMSEAGDALLERATHELHERFGIGHVTLQVVRKPFTRACSSLGSPNAPPE